MIIPADEVMEQPSLAPEGVLKFFIIAFSGPCSGWIGVVGLVSEGNIGAWM